VNYIDKLAATIESNLTEDDRPGDRDTELYRLYALLALVKGAEVTLADVHNAWSVWMAGDQPDHPALVPFAELDVAQRLQDEPYAIAIRQAARA